MMIERARQASVTSAQRRNFGEGHNRPNSGCRLYTGATTPSRGTPSADRDYTQRPRCCFLSVHAIFPPRLKQDSRSPRRQERYHISGLTGSEFALAAGNTPAPPPANSPCAATLAHPASRASTDLTPPLSSPPCCSP